jgi:predicted patatin/cPLA2 family phospholipase
LAKGNNDWVPDWEAGIGYYLEAFRQLKSLVDEVEGHWYKFQEVTRETNRQQALAEAYRKIELAETKSQQALAEAHEKIVESHKAGMRLHYLGFAIALVLFVLSDYEFHIVGRTVEFLISLWR